MLNSIWFGKTEIFTDFRGSCQGRRVEYKTVVFDKWKQNYFHHTAKFLAVK